MFQYLYLRYQMYRLDQEKKKLDKVIKKLREARLISTHRV